MIYPDWLGTETAGGTVTIYAEPLTVEITDDTLECRLIDDTLGCEIDDEPIILTWSDR